MPRHRRRARRSASSCPPRSASSRSDAIGSGRDGSAETPGPSSRRWSRVPSRWPVGGRARRHRPSSPRAPDRDHRGWRALALPGRRHRRELTGYRWPLPKGRLTLAFGPTACIAHRGRRTVPRRHRPRDVLWRPDRGRPRRRRPRRRRHYDHAMGWVGDLSRTLAARSEEALATLPIVVVIDDGNGYRSMYAHFEKVVVKRGQPSAGHSSATRAGPATRRAATSTTGCSARSSAAVRDRAGVVKRMRLPPPRSRASIRCWSSRRARSQRAKPEPGASPRPGVLTRPSAPPVAPADEPVRRDRAERRRQRRPAAITCLEREQPSVGRRRRPRVDDGQVDRDVSGLGLAEPRDQRSGRPPASYSARISASDRQVGWRSRIACQPSAMPGSPARRPARPLGDLLAARPAGGLVEQRRTRRGPRRPPAGPPASPRRRSPGPTGRRPRRDRGRWPVRSDGNRPAGR